MGIFQQMVRVVNRAPVSLVVRFDGQEIDIPPGESQIPEITVSYAKNQNPIMGTADPDNPHISGGEYLIGVIGTRDDCEPLTREQWETHLGRPCRINEIELYADKLAPGERLSVRGRAHRPAAKSSFDTNVRVGSTEGSVFGGSDARE
jgi:hypothetical protein